MLPQTNLITLRPWIAGGGRTSVSTDGNIKMERSQYDRSRYRHPRIRRASLAIIAALASVCVAAPASADGWTSSFAITSVYIAQQNNFQYRINGMPAEATCVNATTWGYINDSDPGSQGELATILGAYYSGKSVSLHVVAVNGFCHIIEFTVSG